MQSASELPTHSITPVTAAHQVDTLTDLLNDNNCLRQEVARLKEQLAKPLNTALFQFAKKGRTEDMEHLLTCGAEINAKDEAGLTALHHCVLNDLGETEHDHLSAAHFLVSKGAVWEHSILRMLCAKGQSDLLHKYLPEYPKLGFCPILELLINQAELINQTQSHACKKVIANFMLLTAIKQGELSYVQYALRKGAEVNIKDQSTTGVYFEFPLTKAASYGHSEIVRCLLENNCDIDAKNSSGETALEVTNRLDLKHLIVIYQLLRAIKAKNLPEVHRILEMEIDLNECKDSLGLTAVHWAVMTANVPLLASLLLKGARANVANAAGETPLHLLMHAETTYPERQRLMTTLFSSEERFAKETVAQAATKIRSQCPELADNMLVTFGKSRGFSAARQSAFFKPRIQAWKDKHSNMTKPESETLTKITGNNHA